MLTAELDRLDALARETDAAQRAHMSATADLDVVAAVILGLVRYLDGVNRYRYRNNRRRSGAWECAHRHVGSNRPGGWHGQRVRSNVH